MCVPAGTLSRYSPLSLVSTLRVVPTITTLTPASGAPDSAATTVPATIPVCCAARGEMKRVEIKTRAAYSGNAWARLMCHRQDDGRRHMWQKTRRRGRRLPRVADGPDAGVEREPLEPLHTGLLARTNAPMI